MGDVHESGCCSVAACAEIIGSKWTALLVHDLSEGPRRFTDLARTDVALPLPCGQTMTGPVTVAAMLLALGVQPGQRILEVGTGSGYVTALLARLGAEVTSVERFNTLAESAAQHLKKLRKRPDAKRLVKIAEQWRPWRSAAALLLWHYRRNMPDWSAKAPKVEPKAAPKLETKTK